MLNTSHEIVVSKLVYGVSSQKECENTLKFVHTFDRNKTKKEYTPNCKLDYFLHDPMSKLIQAEPDPIYVCGITLGVSYTGVCHIDEKVLSSAKKIFNESLSEYNQHMKQKYGLPPIALTPQFILFGEGITQWETS